MDEAKKISNGSWQLDDDEYTDIPSSYEAQINVTMFYYSSVGGVDSGDIGMVEKEGDLRRRNLALATASRNLNVASGDLDASNIAHRYHVRRNQHPRQPARMHRTHTHILDRSSCALQETWMGSRL